MRSRLVAYVCDCGDVRRVGDMGTVTLAAVYQRRPGGCRFAVIEQATLMDALRRHEYLLVDLYELLTTDGADVLLGEYMVFDTEDAAIAAGQMKH